MEFLAPIGAYGVVRFSMQLAGHPRSSKLLLQMQIYLPMQFHLSIEKISNTDAGVYFLNGRSSLRMPHRKKPQSEKTGMGSTTKKIQNPE